MISQPNKNPAHAGVTRVLEVFEQRLATMHALADELRQSSDAVVNLDLLRLERVSERQRQLCEEMRALNRELAEAEARETSPAGRTADPEEFHARMAELKRELCSLQEEIARLTRVQQGLLRRAQRSAQVMANVLAFCFPLFAPIEGNTWPGARK
jgi:chromosome segregation ATPase